MMGCAVAATEKPVEATTSPARLAWLKAELARADMLAHHLRGYLPRDAPGASMVCTMAIQIAAWYGVGDEKWELTNASATMRAELTRIGIRDCILDMNR